MDGAVPGLPYLEQLCGGAGEEGRFQERCRGAHGEAVLRREEAVHSCGNIHGKEERILTGIGELDRVLGGGIVAGSLVLVGGDPGIGKSTPAAADVPAPVRKGEKGTLYFRGGVPAAN